MIDTLGYWKDVGPGRIGGTGVVEIEGCALEVLRGMVTT